MVYRDIRKRARMVLKSDKVFLGIMVILALLVGYRSYSVTVQVRNYASDYFIANSSFFGSVIVLFLTCVIHYLSLKTLYIKFHTSYDLTFDRLKEACSIDDFIKFFILDVNITVRIYLWGLLLIVPGIIKTYAYRCAYYRFMEDPNLSIQEYLQFSNEVSEGKKMNLFLLDLSFILYYLLVLVTMGLFQLLLEPYMLTSQYIAYLDLIGYGYNYERV